MKRLTVITHCYAMQAPHYATHLRFQLNSALIHDFQSRLRFVVFTHPSDKATNEACSDFSEAFSKSDKRIELIVVHLDYELILRRGIGRNLATQKYIEKDDVVWFADADYSFGEHAVDKIATLVNADDRLYSFHTVMINKACPEFQEDGMPDLSTPHKVGDMIVGSAGKYPVIRKRYFAPRRQKTVIGGTQICTGKTAISLGYPEGRKPEVSSGWKRTKEDPIFKRIISRRNGGLPAVTIDCNVFRIRHTVNGRNLALDGSINDNS